MESIDNGKMVERSLKVDVPQLLFPYVQHMVLQISSASGFPPYLMPSFDFEELYEQEKKHKPEGFFDI